MLVTKFTREAIHLRRGRRNLEQEGYEPVSENGSPLWRFQRGDWAYENRIIEDVKVGPDRRSLWIKVSAERAR